MTTGFRVLIVDEDSRRELHHSLYNEGFNVAHVEHLDDAVAVRRIMQFDAVLLRTDPCHTHESRACNMIRFELARIANRGPARF